MSWVTLGVVIVLWRRQVSTRIRCSLDNMMGLVDIVFLGISLMVVEGDVRKTNIDQHKSYLR